MPSVKFIEKYFRKLTPINEAHLNDICTIYIVLELLNLYYEKFDFPLFKVREKFNLKKELFKVDKFRCLFLFKFTRKYYRVDTKKVYI